MCVYAACQVVCHCGGLSLSECVSLCLCVSGCVCVFVSFPLCVFCLSAGVYVSVYLSPQLPLVASLVLFNCESAIGLIDGIIGNMAVLSYVEDSQNRHRGMSLNAFFTSDASNQN